MRTLEWVFYIRMTTLWFSRIRSRLTYQRFHQLSGKFPYPVLDRIPGFSIPPRNLVFSAILYAILATHKSIYYIYTQISALPSPLTSKAFGRSLKFLNSSNHWRWRRSYGKTQEVQIPWSSAVVITQTTVPATSGWVRSSGFIVLLRLLEALSAMNRRTIIECA